VRVRTYSDPHLVDAAELAPGHKHCKNKATVTTLGSHNFGVPGVKTQVCQMCTDDSYTLLPSCHIGGSIAGMCQKIDDHTLWTEIESKCVDEPCTKSSMPLKCQEFISGWGVVDGGKNSRGIPKLYAAGGKTDDDKRPEAGDIQAVAFTCGSIRVVDYFDATMQGNYITNIYRLVQGELTSCFSTDEAGQPGDTPKMHCVKKQALKSCHTRSIATGSHTERNTIKQEQGVSRAAANALMKEQYINSAFQSLDNGTDSTSADDSEWTSCDFLAQARGLSTRL